MFLDWQESFSTTRAVTAAVHSTCVGIVFGGGVLAGYVNNKVGARVTFILGAFLATLGMFLGALVTTIPLLLFSVGIVAGCGFCLIQLPCIPCCTQPFKTNQGVNIAVVATGAGILSVVLPYLFAYLVEVYSWRGAFIIISGLSLNTLVLSMIMTSYVAPPKSKNILLLSPETEILLPDGSNTMPSCDFKIDADKKIANGYNEIDDGHMKEIVRANDGGLNISKLQHFGSIEGGEGHIDNFVSDLSNLQLVCKDGDELPNQNNPYVDTVCSVSCAPLVENGLSRTERSDLQISEQEATKIRHDNEVFSGRETAIQLRELDVDKYSEPKTINQNNRPSTQSEKVESLMYADQRDETCEQCDETDMALARGDKPIETISTDQRLNPSISFLSVAGIKQSPWRFLLDPLAWSVLAYLGLVLAVLFTTQMLTMDLANNKGFPEHGLLILMVSTLSGLVAKALSGLVALRLDLSSFVCVAVSGIVGSGALAMLGNVTSLAATLVSMTVIGLCLGVIVSVFPKCLLDLKSVDSNSYPLALGSGNTMEGVFDFVLPILVGHMVDVSGTYALPFSILSGVSLICSTVLIVVYRLTRKNTEV
ncbi:hypothetical protein EGW08_020795 [Elysia chlorotica]|uniref:Major facilitator superfamily (MFS) profile domain-containing protein n=1 Tax=Elysia chlorotica TaxID=188477 RepID=A0A433SQE8_ELYCH|nr:hypothetical protein EGW08_020795 [Elysia chlorotica]